MSRLVLIITLGVSFAIAPNAQSSTLNFPDFSDVSAWQLNGDAATSGTGKGAVLRVTPSKRFQSGSAFLKDTISLQNEASFSAFFQLRISNPGGITDIDGVQGADGIVFAVQTLSNNAGSSGGGIGYQGITPSVGVEFDSWNNGDRDHFNGNHIGINVNGTVYSNPLVKVSPILNNGSIYSTWVDYNGLMDTLEVRFSDTNTRPNAPIASLNIDLEKTLGVSNVFVGFTSGTGSAFNDHDILNLTFSNNFAPISSDNSLESTSTGVPEPSSVVGFLGIGVLALARKFKSVAE